MVAFVRAGTVRAGLRGYVFRARSLRGTPRLFGEFSMGDAALVCGDWCWAGVALSVGYRGEGR